MFIEADGKRFQVRHLCHSTDEANELCAADIKLNGQATIGVIDTDETTRTTILADIKPMTTPPEPPTPVTEEDLEEARQISQMHENTWPE
jgi:hypothetical protein